MTRILVIILALASLAQAEIRIEGNRHFKKSDLLKEFQSNSKLDEFKRLIEGAYVADGFFDVQIRYQISPDTTFFVDEGKVYRSSIVALHGLDTNMFSSRQLYREDRTLTDDYLALLTQRIVRSYADGGYPFCQAGIERVEASSDSLYMYVAVTRGPLATFGTTRFVGLETTKPARVQKHLSYREGERYRESDLHNTEQSFARMEYTRLMQPARVTHNVITQAADITLIMKDSRNLNASGILALNPDNSPGGVVNVDFANLFGTGEKVGLHWRRPERNSLDVGFALELPDIASYPIDLTFGALQSDRDSSFVRARLELGTRYHINQQWSLAGTLSWEKLTPDEGRLSPSARAIGAAFATSYDGRDDIHRTRMGLRFVSEIGSTYRHSYNSSDEIQTGYTTALKAVVEGWLPASKKLVFYQRLSPFQTRSDFEPIPTDQLIDIGGVATLRGYRERSFLADLGIVSATELGYHINDDVVGRIFCDNAYIETQAGPRHLTGFGVGLGMATSLGEFRMDLSLGEEKQFSRMLVHFGFESGL